MDTPEAMAGPSCAAVPSQQQRHREGPAPARQPSVAELVVGSPAASPQLPPAPPLLLHSTTAAPQLGPPRAALAVGGAKRAAVLDASADPAQLAERRQQLQACSDAAAAGLPQWDSPAALKDDPEGLPLPPVTPSTLSGMDSAAHRDAAAAHAVQAVALQQQMYLQSAMMGCSTSGSGSCTAASQLAAQPTPQPCGGQGWPGIGAMPAWSHSQSAETALLQRAGFGAPIGSAFPADPALSQLYGCAGAASPHALQVGLSAGLQAQLQALPAHCGTGSMSTQASRGLQRG